MATKTRNKTIPKKKYFEPLDSSLKDFLEKNKITFDKFNQYSAAKQLDYVRGFCFFLYAYVDGADRSEGINFDSLHEYATNVIKVGEHAEQEDIISQFQSMGDWD